MVKHYLIRVSGDVQGVFFRQSTQEKASSLQLKGTVQNTPDGSVEIYAEGEESKLQELIKWCQNGPEHANVNEVKYQEEPAKNYDKFNII